MKKVNIGDYVICIKSLSDGGKINDNILGYTLDKSYKISYIHNREVSVETDLSGYSKTFYTEVNENECMACLWDYFGLIKDLRKKKLKRLKIFLEEENP